MQAASGDKDAVPSALAGAMSLEGGEEQWKAAHLGVEPGHLGPTLGRERLVPLKLG